MLIVFITRSGQISSVDLAFPKKCLFSPENKLFLQGPAESLLEPGPICPAPAVLPHLPSLSPLEPGACLRPTTAPAPPPARQRTLEVIGLVKVQPDLVSVALAALAHAGDAKTEAGQAGGAVLQVEVSVGAGPCRAAQEWLQPARQMAPAPPPARRPPAHPTAVPRCGMSSRTPSGMPNTMPRAFMASQV